MTVKQLDNTLLLNTTVTYSVGLYISWRSPQK